MAKVGGLLWTAYSHRGGAESQKQVMDGALESIHTKKVQYAYYVLRVTKNNHLPSVFKTDGFGG